MKKILLAGLLVVFSSSMSFAAATSAIGFAADGNAGKTIVGGTNADGTENAKNIGKLSTSVALGFNVAAGGYAIITQHGQGTKAFGTSHDSTAIYSMTVVKLATTAAPDAAAASAISGAGWTAQ